jgi:cobalt-zinc-cadmium resistance protein CzcA
LFIRDVAKVKTGFATRYGMTYNDQGEVSGAVVMMLKGENSNQVIKNVKRKNSSNTENTSKRSSDRTFPGSHKNGKQCHRNSRKNLTEGALIVVFVLVFFSGIFGQDCLWHQ